MPRVTLQQAEHGGKALLGWIKACAKRPVLPRTSGRVQRHIHSQLNPGLTVPTQPFRREEGVMSFLKRVFGPRGCSAQGAPSTGHMISFRPTSDYTPDVGLVFFPGAVGKLNELTIDPAGQGYNSDSDSSTCSAESDGSESDWGSEASSGDEDLPSLSLPNSRGDGDSGGDTGLLNTTSVLPLEWAGGLLSSFAAMMQRGTKGPVLGNGVSLPLLGGSISRLVSGSGLPVRHPNHHGSWGMRVRRYATQTPYLPEGRFPDGSECHPDVVEVLGSCQRALELKEVQDFFSVPWGMSVRLMFRDYIQTQNFTEDQIRRQLVGMFYSISPEERQKMVVELCTYGLPQPSAKQSAHNIFLKRMATIQRVVERFLEEVYQDSEGKFSRVEFLLTPHGGPDYQRLEERFRGKIALGANGFGSADPVFGLMNTRTSPEQDIGAFRKLDEEVGLASIYVSGPSTVFTTSKLEEIAETHRFDDVRDLAKKYAENYPRYKEDCGTNFEQFLNLFGDRVVFSDTGAQAQIEDITGSLLNKFHFHGCGILPPGQNVARFLHFGVILNRSADIPLTFDVNYGPDGKQCPFAGNGGTGYSGNFPISVRHIGHLLYLLSQENPHDIDSILKIFNCLFHFQDSSSRFCDVTAKDLLRQSSDEGDLTKAIILAADMEND